MKGRIQSQPQEPVKFESSIIYVGGSPLPIKVCLTCGMPILRNYAAEKSTAEQIHINWHKEQA